MFSDAEKLLNTALEDGLVNLQVSTVLFIGKKDSFYGEMLLGEAESIPNYRSNFYSVNGEEVKTLKPEHLDYFFACNAMVPQESSTHGIDKQEVSFGQSSNLKQNTSRTYATSKIASSEPEITNPKQKEANYDQKVHRRSSIDDSEESQERSNTTTSTGKYVSTETPGNVLKLMHKVSKEMHRLQLIHAIDCSDLNILPILPLIVQCTISFGVGYTMTDSVQILNAIQHLSKKWYIIKTEETSVELSKVFNSHKAPFKTNFSLETEISMKDIALLSHKTEEKAIPYAWYYFCHAIQNAFKGITRKVISIVEILDITEKCHISRDKLSIVLSYLHKTGLLLYYGDILPNVIFEDASLIVKILSSAILKPFDSGIFHCSSLRQVEDVYVDDIFTFQDAIKLLRNLGIIFLIDKQLFCVPTLLTSIIDEKHMSEQGNIPPLHIQYSAAPGVFEYLLCYLTSEQNRILWPWKIHSERNRTEPSIVMYKNCAELVLPGYDCIIILLQLSDHITVYVKFVDSQPPFAKIGDSIVTGVKRAISSYNYPDVEIKLGFSCICGSVDFEHTMVYRELDRHLKCACDSSGVTFQLSHYQKVWFEEGMVLC